MQCRQVVGLTFDITKGYSTSLRSNERNAHVWGTDTWAYSMVIWLANQRSMSPAMRLAKASSNMSFQSRLQFKLPDKFRTVWFDSLQRNICILLSNLSITWSARVNRPQLQYNMKVKIWQRRHAELSVIFTPAHERSNAESKFYTLGMRFWS